ncbi:MAG: hypothetical protein AB7V13_03930 [Pseudorhodoplanes sp.]
MRNAFDIPRLMLSLDFSAVLARRTRFPILAELSHRARPADIANFRIAASAGTLMLRCKMKK